MNRFLSAIVGLTLLISGARADAPGPDAGPPPSLCPPGAHCVLFNGALMQVIPLAFHAMAIVYIVPPPNDVGILPGTFLIRGKWNGPTLEATAFIFTFNCGQQPYPVRGSMAPNGVLTLIGPAPIIDPTCIYIGSAPSTLVFVPQL